MSKHFAYLSSLDFEFETTLVKSPGDGVYRQTGAIATTKLNRYINRDARRTSKMDAADAFLEPHDELRLAKAGVETLAKNHPKLDKALKRRIAMAEKKIKAQADAQKAHLEVSHDLPLPTALIESETIGVGGKLN